VLLHSLKSSTANAVSLMKCGNRIAISTTLHYGLYELLHNYLYIPLELPRTVLLICVKCVLCVYGSLNDVLITKEVKNTF